MINAFVHALILILLGIASAQENKPREIPGLPSWVASIFHETTLCGEVPADMKALLDTLAPLKNEERSKKSVKSLFNILSKWIEKKPIPTVGGCHAGLDAEAIDPMALASLARDDKEAIVQFSTLADSKNIPTLDRAGWYHAVASVEGFETPAGRNHLERSFKIFDQHYSQNDRDQFNTTFQDVFRLLGKKPATWDVVLKTFDRDGCGEGYEYSILGNSLSPKELSFLKTTMTLLFPCHDPPENECLDSGTTTNAVPGLLLEPDYQGWLGKKGVGLVRSLLDNSTSIDKKKARDELRKILDQKVKIRRRFSDVAC